MFLEMMVGMVVVNVVKKKKLIRVYLLFLNLVFLSILMLFKMLVGRKKCVLYVIVKLMKK